MPQKQEDFWELGPFIIESKSERVVYEQEPVKVGVRCFSVLVALMEADGRVVAKENLILAGWGTAHVDDSNLTHCVTELRRVLGRGFGELTTIETVPRVGYRLAVPAKRSTQSRPMLAASTRTRYWAVRAAVALTVFALCSGTAFLAWSRATARRGSDSLYQEGLYLLRQRNSKSLPQAAEMFRKGTTLYPEDGRFYAGFAETMVLQRSVNHDLALETARKAVTLSPDSSHGRAVLGFILFSRFYNWSEGERELHAALQVDPKNTQAMIWLTLLHIGRNETVKALAWIDKAIAIEPSSPNLRSARAGVYYASGRYDDCVQEADVAISLQSDFPMSHAWRAKCHLAANRPIAFIDAITRARAVWYNADEKWRQGEHEELVAEFKRGGMDGVHRKLLAYATEKGSGLVAFDQAISHAALGEHGTALDLLEDACRRRSRDMIFLQAVPAFQPLHATERWRRLLAAVNLRN